MKHFPEFKQKTIIAVLRDEFDQKCSDFRKTNDVAFSNIFVLNDGDGLRFVCVFLGTGEGFQ